MATSSLPALSAAANFPHLTQSLDLQIPWHQKPEHANLPANHYIITLTMDDDIWDPEGDQLFNYMFDGQNSSPDTTSQSVSTQPLVINLESDDDHQQLNADDNQINASPPNENPPLLALNVNPDSGHNKNTDDNGKNRNNYADASDHNANRHHATMSHSTYNIRCLNSNTPPTPPSRPITGKIPGPKSATTHNQLIIRDIEIPLIRIDTDNYAHVNEPNLHITPRDGPYNPSPSSSSLDNILSTYQRKLVPFNKSLLKTSRTNDNINPPFPPAISNYLPFDNESTLTNSAKAALQSNPYASCGFAFAASISHLLNHQTGDHPKEEKSDAHVVIHPCSTAKIPNSMFTKFPPPAVRVYLQNASHFLGFAASHALHILKETNRYENRSLYNQMTAYFSNLSMIAIKDNTSINLKPILDKMGPGLASTQYIILFPGTGIQITKSFDVNGLDFPFPTKARDVINQLSYSPIDVKSIRHRLNKVLHKWGSNYREDQVYNTITNILPNLFSFISVKRDPIMPTTYLIHLSQINSYFQLDENQDVIGRTIMSWKMHNPNSLKWHATSEYLPHQDYDIFPYNIPERNVYTRTEPLNLTLLDTSSYLKTNPWILLMNQSVLPRSWSFRPDYLLEHPSKVLFEQGKSHPLDVIVPI